MCTEGFSQSLLYFCPDSARAKKERHLVIQSDWLEFLGRRRYELKHKSLMHAWFAGWAVRLDGTRLIRCVVSRVGFHFLRLISCFISCAYLISSMRCQRPGVAMGVGPVHEVDEGR